MAPCDAILYKWPVIANNMMICVQLGSYEICWLFTIASVELLAFLLILSTAAQLQNVQTVFEDIHKILYHEHALLLKFSSFFFSFFFCYLLLIYLLISVSYCKCSLTHLKPKSRITVFEKNGGMEKNIKPHKFTHSWKYTQSQTFHQTLMILWKKLWIRLHLNEANREPLQQV